MGDTELARQRRCVEQISACWPGFLAARQTHLRAHAVGQSPSEKVAENILCDLFTTVLDWSTEQIRLQESRVDILVTRLGVKYLIIEAKRPGSLDGPASTGRALRQALGYAQEPNVGAVRTYGTRQFYGSPASAHFHSRNPRNHTSAGVPVSAFVIGPITVAMDRSPLRAQAALGAKNRAAATIGRGWA